MGEFDRAETLRRSFRRPGLKPRAPPPPISPLQDKVEAPGYNANAVACTINKLRDFVASPPVDSTKPRVVSATPLKEDDSSHSALLAIQQQINKIEFNSNFQPKHVEAPKPEIHVHKGRTRYDEMESLLNTGISDMMTNVENDDDDDEDYASFHRGGATRSSVQGVPRNIVDPKKIKQSRPVARTASDTSQIEIVRKQIRQRDTAAISRVDGGKKSSDQVT